MTGWFGGFLVGLCLMAQAAFGQGAAMPSNPIPVLETIELTGGSKDDHSYATAALGFIAGDSVGQEAFQLALEAVRATDRFRVVEGSLEDGPAGQVAIIQLEPWPEIQSREFRGNLPKKFQRGLFTGMHEGGRAGDLRIQRWQSEAEQRLKDEGYPTPSVRVLREEGGARLVIQVDVGPPALVRTFQVEGGASLYTADRLRDVAGIDLGKTLWTETAQREALLNLRERLVKDKRYEGTLKFLWDLAKGHLILQIQPGPVVRLRQEGDWSFRWTDLDKLVPLVRAGSYSPELLDEGDRRIMGYLREKGYLDANVTHRREILRGSKEQPEEVVITYDVKPGDSVTIEEVVFQRNKAFTTEELTKVAALPSGVWSMGDPPATPALISAIEDRLKHFYWNNGYPDMSVRRPPMDRTGGKAKLVIQVREGARQMVDKLVLDMPADPSWQPWMMAETLPYIFSNELHVESSPDENTRIYRSDRSVMADVYARIEGSLDPSRPAVRTFTLTLSRPLPFVKNDLVMVFAALRRKVASLGVQRPQPRLRLDPGDNGYLIRFEVPDQPRVIVNRVVVQGADSTRAKAVLRELNLVPGVPLDAARISQAQGNLGNLGAFQRTDLLTFGDEPTVNKELPWQDGDLLLRADERRPWVLSSGFGYDKSQGYHVGLGAQRMNFMGMGRSLDFATRMGDNTFDNPTLRKWFPTGEYDRSVDSFSIGYTDPWFLPGKLKGILQDRTQYRAEGAFVEETQSAFIANRKRILNTLDWKQGDHQRISLGHRYEKTEIKPNNDGIELEELFTLARVPDDKTTLSVPFLQIVRDKRDNPQDPKSGTYFFGKLEMANQLFGTGSDYSYVKLDLRHQWNWPMGEQARWGVLMASARIGLASPTASDVDEVPLAERFFAGGPSTVRGVEPDMLGPTGTVGEYDYVNGTSVQTGTRDVPLGGQGLIVLNLEYRFPLFGSDTVWGEVFADSGQVYAKLNPDPREEGDPAPFPPLRTTLGLGLIFKVGLPIKFEYAADLKRILGQERSQDEEDTELRGLLVSMGYQY
jgi:outer membrane protein assembly factor BamA